MREDIARRKKSFASTVQSALGTKRQFKRKGIMQQLELLQKRVSESQPGRQGYMQHTRASAANERSEHFKQLRAAVDASKMSVDQANELIMQHSKNTNKAIIKEASKAA